MPHTELSRDERKFCEQIDAFVLKRYYNWLCTRVKESQKRELYRQCGLQTDDNSHKERPPDDSVEQHFKRIIGFEALRSFKRYYLWSRLSSSLCGESTKKQARDYITQQNQEDGLPKSEFLTDETFQGLIYKLEDFHYTNKQLEVLGDTAFIHKSQAASQSLLEKTGQQIDHPEKFLQAATIAVKNDHSIFHITDEYDKEQKNWLAHCYTGRLHLRQIMFGMASAYAFKETLEAINDETNFKMSMGRWIVDILGFDKGKSISETSTLRLVRAFNIIEQLRGTHLTLQTAQNNLIDILMSIPDDFGISTQDNNQTKLLTCLILEGYPIKDQEAVNYIQTAVNNFNNKNQLTTTYKNMLGQAMYIPTCTPAIFKDALNYCTNSLGVSKELAHKTATVFTLKVFEKAFQKQLHHPTQPIDLQNITYSDQSQAPEVLQSLSEGYKVNISLTDDDTIRLQQTHSRLNLCDRLCQNTTRLFSQGRTETDELRQPLNRPGHSNYSDDG